MTYFNPSSTLPNEHIDRTATAYIAAGLTPPNQAHLVSERLGSMPDYATVLHTVATESLNADDPDAYLEDAITRIQRAKAAEELRATLPRVLSAVEQESAPERINRTAEDLTPFFTKTVKALKQATAKLDQREPLSIENAVRDDTTKELKTAQAALSTLARLLEAYPSQQDHRVPYQVMNLLPIISIPDVGPTQYVSGMGYAQTITDEHSSIRAGLRRLVKEITNDIDKAIIDLTNDHYPGLTLTLATTDEYERRREAAALAYSEVPVDENGTRILR